MNITRISENVYIFKNNGYNTILTENGLDKTLEKLFETYHTGITTDSNILVNDKTIRIMFDMKSDGFDKDEYKYCKLTKHKFSRYELNIEISLYNSFSYLCDENKCIGSVYFNYVRCGNYLNPVLYKRNANDEFVFIILSNKNSF